MMYSAAKSLFAILVGYLALVGLTQICLTVARWFSTAGEMDRCWLLVVAAPQDQGIEGPQPSRQRPRHGRRPHGGGRRRRRQ